MIIDFYSIVHKCIVLCKWDKQATTVADRMELNVRQTDVKFGRYALVCSLGAYREHNRSNS